MMHFLVEDSRARLHRGRRLVTLVNPDLAATLSLFIKGGLAILKAIAAQDYDTLTSRPVVTKVVKIRLLGEALLGKAGSIFRAAPTASERPGHA